MAGDSERLIFRVHAIQRMFQRGVTVDDMREVRRPRETIENYPDDTPMGEYQGRASRITLAGPRRLE